MNDSRRTSNLSSQPAREGDEFSPLEFERRILRGFEAGRLTEKQMLSTLTWLYSNTNRTKPALECATKLVALARSADEQAFSHLNLGRLAEQMGDFPGAIGHYRDALEVGPQNTDTSYWINNNLGYSLIQNGEFAEAEAYLRTAIEIDPKRSNAFKNLGLTLAGQGDSAGAVECFVAATHVNPRDPRALGHLEALVSAHPRLLMDLKDLAGALDACRRVVEAASSPEL